MERALDVDVFLNKAYEVGIQTLELIKTRSGRKHLTRTAPPPSHLRYLANEAELEESVHLQGPVDDHVLQVIDNDN